MTVATHCRRKSAYQADVDNYPLLDADDERTLALRVMDKDADARDRLTKSNLRMVLKVAHKYRGRGVELDDLIEEGNLGLIRAVESYDPGYGTRFATFAAPWIEQQIRLCVRQKSRLVRVPRSRQVSITKYQKSAEALAGTLGRDPTDAEVAKDMGISPGRVWQIRRAIFVADSGFCGFGAHESWPWIRSKSCDERAENPLEAAIVKDDVSRILSRMSRLTEQELRVIKMRFGIHPFTHPMTGEEIGDVLEMTRQAIHKIQTKAFDKLRIGG